MSIKSLYEQRLAVHNQAVQFLAAKEFTAEKRSSFDAAMKEVQKLTDQIKAAEAGNGDFSTRINRQINVRHEAAFGRYLRGHMMNDAEQRDLNEGAPGSITNHIGTYTGLGYYVPTGFVNAIEQALKYYAPLADGSVFRLMETATGNPLPFPTNDDTADTANITAEAGAFSDAGTAGTTGQVVFGAYKFTAGPIKASLELIQDSAFNVENWLADLFSIRFGRKLEDKLTNGSGSSEPTGLLTAVAASGAVPVIAAGSSANDGSAATGVNSIGYGDLVNLEHSVDPSYRRGAKYMFHDQTLSKLKQLVDKFGRPLWAPGIAADVPDTLNGYEYVINQAMPQVGASNVTIAFGDMSKFVIRRVQGYSIQRLNELYSANGQIGFLAHCRLDSNLLSNGGRAINVLQQHS